MDPETDESENQEAEDRGWLHRCHAADAYVALGMSEEALGELGSVPDGSPHRHYAEYRTMCIEVALGRFAEAIERGRTLERAGWKSHLLYDWIGLAYHLDGRNCDALEAWRPIQPRFWHDANGSYGMACALSELGRFEEAARWLIRCFSLAPRFHAKAFIDVEIEPLLAHGAEAPPDASILDFAHPSFQRALARARACDDQVNADARLLEVVPLHLRSWLQTDLPLAVLRLHPRAPREARQAYREWQTRRIAANASLGERARARAVQWILDQQPTWAEAHARRGNPLAARYHSLFAIARQPENYEAIGQRLRGIGIDYLFDDLRQLPRDQAVAMARLWLRNIHREANLPQDLRDIGTAAGRSSLGLLMTASAFLLRNDPEGAARAHAQASIRWPQDPAPWTNRIIALTQIGRWEEASSLFDAAPPHCAALLAWEALARRIRHRNTDIPIPTHDAFFGQPDLGGILLPEWHIPPTHPPHL